MSAAPDVVPKVSRRAMLAGWAGTAAILLAQYLLRSDTIEQGLIYNTLNLFGGLALVNVCVRRRAWQPAVLNGAWAAIALERILMALFVP
ncbi:MAG: hypothetical protein R3F34_07030 [Planctomycetota bacterium]